MIFTSYFAMIRNFPSNIIPIGISRWKPKWYEGINEKCVAPSAELLSCYKGKKLDEDDYTQRYLEELSHIDIDAFIQKLIRYTGDCEDGLPVSNSTTNHVALLCYEKPSDFCHRHILAEEIKAHGYPCMELSKEDISKIRDYKIKPEEDCYYKK